MTRVLNQWGKKVVKFKWVILIASILLIVASGWFSTKLTPLLSGGGWTVDGSDSLKVSQILSEKDFEGRSGTNITLVIRDQNNEVGTRGYESTLENVVERLKIDENLEVGSIYTLLNAPPKAKESLVGDEHTTIGFVGFEEEDGYARNKLPILQEELKEFGGEGVDVHLVGESSFWGEINVLSKEGLAQAEMIVLPLILIILLFVFRSFVAAVTPLVIGIAAIIMTFGVLTLIAQNTQLSIFVTNAATMLGLGVAVDYSLFMVNRFKEELAKRNSVNDAISVMMSTAGDAVIFSGITIIASVAVLFIVDLNVIHSVAVGLITVVCITLFVSMTLLPAFLSILGNKINKGKIPFLKASSSGSFWYRFSHKVMKRPVMFLFLAVLILGVFAFPAKDLQTFTPDAGILPEESNSKKGYEIIQNEYGIGYTSPIRVVVDTADGRVTDHSGLKYIKTLTEDIGNFDNVEEVNSITTILKGQSIETITKMLNTNEMDSGNLLHLVNRYVGNDRTATIIEVIPQKSGASKETRNLIKKIHEHVDEFSPPTSLSVYVGGETAQGRDSNAVIADSLPIVLALMLIIGYFILMITFRSVLLPIKAILMNLLSLGATYGILILVFQYGFGSELLNFEPEDYVTNFVPILLLALLFSLSTDYEVFLISRMREEYLKTGDNEESVATGIKATAPMISGAAFLMVAVFAGFALTSVLPIQQLGLGMAVAIAIDATIIRLILVPATMKLMGRWNWWLPKTKSKDKKGLETV